MIKTLEFFGLSAARPKPVLHLNRRVKLNRRDNFWFFASIVILILILVLLMSYLLGVNSYTTSGYEIRKIQNNLNQYTEENKKLNLQVAEISSVAKVQNNLKSNEFVSASIAKFLDTDQFSIR